MSALVTGASGGLGREVALALARGGHDVAVHYRGDAAGAEETAAGVREAGRRAATLHADLDVPLGEPDVLETRCADLLERCAERLGEPAVVVLNAFPQHQVAWEELDAAAWDAYHRAGLRPSAVLLHRSAARMAEGGVVVVVGSIEGLRAMPGHAPYAVAKAALHHLVGAAAHELGRRGVRVVGVSPGLVERAGLAQAWPEGVTRYRAAAALGRPVRPEEVAATVAFLASPVASGITGTTVTVDAGWSAGPGW
ncbi:SDR family oxidoreductase [Phycicoccus endophyticus]|uniref:SDR family oxidoreductase n=1 Tax=Phycicoccus endophyticus TaxID=1690220 RepID=A0A7G9R0P8_9MICO|nr:SDR family oxidoreductase [Phycicoccus endophyticus]NHI19457.1 SDR family oxidoreductase [Phycicoccus endophyticus]QNN49173.1 SDR family oxidoreductase [Phycicoccus endophyticus]GGL39339.1 glucose 1-dehydrogenase [Phycicoccus endophyticus]